MLSRSAIRGEPSVANTVKHGRVQNAAEGLNRDEIRSRQPRDAADVYPPVQAIPTRGAHQRGADEAMDRRVQRLTQRFAWKLVQHEERAVWRTRNDFGVAPVAIRQAWQKRLFKLHSSPIPTE